MSQELSFIFENNYYRLNYVDNDTWDTLVAKIREEVAEPLPSVQFEYFDNGTAYTVRNVNRFQSDIASKNRLFTVKPRADTSPSQAPEGRNEGQSRNTDDLPTHPIPLHIARFPNRKPASRPIPLGEYHTLIELKKWAYDLMIRVPVPEAKKRKADELNIFYTTRHTLAVMPVTTDDEYVNILDGTVAMFYFTFEPIVRETISTDDLSISGTPATAIDQFVEELYKFKQRSIMPAHTVPDALDKLGTALHEILSGGDIILVDEIQAHPTFTRHLVRALAKLTTDPRNRLGLRRLVLLGTPPSLFAKDAMVFKEDEWNKVDARPQLSPLTPKLFLEILERIVGFLPAREMLFLWTMTGGNPRQLQSILIALNHTYQSSGNKPLKNTSRTFDVLQYNALKKWIIERCNQVHQALSSTEWELVKAIGRKQSIGLPMAASPMVESLRAKGIVSHLDEDLKGSSSTCLALADGHIRSLVLAEMFRKSSPLQLLHGICGFGLKDFVSKLIEEFLGEREEGNWDVEPQLVVDGINLASFVPASLAYSEHDPDMVLVKPPLPSHEETQVELVLGSCKLARSALMKKHPEEFCARNVLDFLRTKLPPNIKINRCIVVGLSMEEGPSQEDRREQERKKWDDALAILRTNLPGIQFEAKVWSLSMILQPLRKPGLDTQTPYPIYDSSNTIADSWPILERPEFKNVLWSCLEQGRSLLVRGFAGVGKTVYTRRLIQEWVDAQATPPNVHMLDVFTLLR